MKQIDEYISALPKWQGDNLHAFRSLVHDVEPLITEDWKWNVPVFMLNGKMLFAMSAFKAHTKYNFIQNGALLTDTDTLFNNGFESAKSRGIDLREGEAVDGDKLRQLVVDAVRTTAS